MRSRMWLARTRPSRRSASKQVGAGHHVGFHGVDAARLERLGGAGLEGQRGFVDRQAPLAGPGQENDFAVAEAVGGQNLAFLGAHDAALERARETERPRDCSRRESPI